ISVSELCEMYMEAARAGLVLTRFRIPKRQSTVRIDEGRATRHIVSLIGSTIARDLTRADIQRMVDQITQRRTRGVHKGNGSAKPSSKAGEGQRPVWPPFWWHLHLGREARVRCRSKPCAG